MPSNVPASARGKRQKPGEGEETTKDAMWKKLFKSAEPTTDVDSLLYQSRVAYICITQYLLYRRLLPMGVFEKRRIAEDAVIHTFKRQHSDGNENRWGIKLSDMMKGMTEAIQHKYARQVIIMINEDPDEPASATEVFTISFAYNQDDAVRLLDEEGNVLASLSYKGKEQFRKQVAYVLEKIAYVVSKLPKIDRAVKPKMKLTYYESRTPKDYQPTAFKECSETYYFKTKPPQMRMDSIGTGHGALTFDLQSDYIGNVEELEEAIEEGAEGVDLQRSIENTVTESLFKEELEVRRSSPPMFAPIEEAVDESVPMHEIVEEEEEPVSSKPIATKQVQKKGATRKQPQRAGKEGGVAKRAMPPAQSSTPRPQKPPSSSSRSSQASSTGPTAKGGVTVRKPTNSSRPTESPTTKTAGAVRRIYTPYKLPSSRDVVRSDSGSGSSKYGEPMK